MTLEQRLRIELKLAGLLYPDDTDEKIDQNLLARQDDTICVEIRSLVKELKAQIQYCNNQTSVLRKHIVYQLDEELYKRQVEEESKLIFKKYQKIWRRKKDALKKKKNKSQKAQAAYPTLRGLDRNR